MVACSAAGRSKAVCRTTASDELEIAWASVFLVSPSSLPSRRTKTSTRRSSRLAEARSPSAFRVMANTSFCTRSRSVWRSLPASACSAACCVSFQDSAALRASVSNFSRSALASSVALVMRVLRCSSKALFFASNASWSFCAWAFLLLASATAAAMRFSRTSMALRMGR
jgi:hypothetical protein